MSETYLIIYRKWSWIWASPFSLAATKGIPTAALQRKSEILNSKSETISNIYMHAQSKTFCLFESGILNLFRLSIFKFRASVAKQRYMLVSFPLGTEMFHFSRCTSRHIAGITLFSQCWVPPFGNRRVKGCSTPHRRLSQPSHVLRRLSKPRHPPFALIIHSDRMSDSGHQYDLLTAQKW